MPKTNFRPDTDGFDFNNNWNFDANEIRLIQTIANDAIGPASAILAPILMPIFISAAAAAEGPLDFLGSLIGIPPGTVEAVEPLATAMALGYVKDNLNGWVKSAAAGSGKGFCGGMAFTPLDYFKLNWIIQKGRGSFTPPGESKPISVPQDDTPEGLALRTYIFSRHLDTWKSGTAVKVLEWMARLFLVPSSLGGGASDLFNRTKGEWSTLKQTHLDNGEPWPLALIFNSKSPFDQHQVLAYGYDIDANGNVVVFVYDSNVPNEETTIRIQFGTGTMSITDSNGQVILNEDMKPMYPDALVGAFCENYFLSVPPIGIGLSQGLDLDRDCANYGDKIKVSYTAQNTGFKDSINIALGISDNAGNHLGEKPSEAKSIQYGMSRSLPNSVEEVFNYQGIKTINVECLLTTKFPLDNGTTTVSRTLPPIPPGGKAASATVRIFPPLQIQVVPKGDYGCMPPGVEGQSVTLRVANLTIYTGSTYTIFGDYDLSGLQYEWSASAGTPQAANKSTFTIDNLPAAGTQVTIRVAVTHPNGCRAFGSLVLTTSASDIASLEYRACVLIHKLQEEERRLPGLPQDQGDPAELIQHFLPGMLEKMHTSATNLARISSELITLQAKLKRHQGRTNR